MAKKPPQNIGEEAQVKANEEKREHALLRSREDLRTVLSTRQGRRFFWNLIGFCGLLRSSMHHNGSQTYFNEGMRSVGLHLWREMESANADAYLVMLKESKEDTE